MKKMLLILAMCAFVSVSSAAIMFEVDSQTVLEGETFQVRVVATTDGIVNISLGAITIENAASWGAPTIAGFTASAIAGEVKDGSVNNIAYFQASGSNGTGVFFNTGTVLYSFDVTAGAAGTTIVLDDWEGTNPFGMPPFPVSTTVNSAASPLEALVVNVVPEPMTMALLGLGGLFIRRRRA